jgi:hypothetical protein
MSALEAEERSSLTRPTLPYDILLSSEATRFDLGAWRKERLGQLKRTAEYRSLAPILRWIVDYMIRSHDNPTGGMFPSQETLGKKFNVERQTMNGYLRAIEQAGVFTKESRYSSGFGRQTKRLSNVYRINEAILEPEQVSASSDVRADIRLDRKLSTESTDEVPSPREHIEAPSKAKETELDLALDARPTPYTAIASQEPSRKYETARQQARERYRAREGHYPGEQPKW